MVLNLSQSDTKKILKDLKLNVPESGQPLQLSQCGSERADLKWPLILRAAWGIWHTGTLFHYIFVKCTQDRLKLEPGAVWQFGQNLVWKPKGSSLTSCGPDPDDAGSLTDAGMSPSFRQQVRRKLSCGKHGNKDDKDAEVTRRGQCWCWWQFSGSILELPKTCTH